MTQQISDFALEGYTYDSSDRGKLAADLSALREAVRQWIQADKKLEAQILEDDNGSSQKVVRAVRVLEAKRHALHKEIDSIEEANKKSVPVVEVGGPMTPEIKSALDNITEDDVQKGIEAIEKKHYITVKELRENMNNMNAVVDLSSFGYRGESIPLRKVIKILKEYPFDRVIKKGFGSPNSYRGYYECLAFAPATNVTIGSMLEEAESANGATFTGYKGGEYRMDLEAPCYIASYGSYGGDNDILTEPLLRLMCEQVADD